MSDDNNIINMIMHPADNGGCAHYRCKFPAWNACSLHRNLRVNDLAVYLPFPAIYKRIRSVRMQRNIGHFQCEFILKFLKPYSDLMGFWLCYEIDDVIGMDDIPRYNRGWQAFQDKGLMDNLKKILDCVDIITVTTQELKNYFVQKFNVGSQKVLVIPNYLPKWWIDRYSELEIRAKVARPGKRRVGIISSLSHYDVDNVNGGIDDLYHLNDFVRSTSDTYEWVFVGGISQQLKDLQAAKKIECHKGFDIMNYPREIYNLRLDAVVAPLLDNTFNRCKSNIKFIECAAMGIPIVCQDICTYNQYTKSLFKNANSLQDSLDRIFSNSDEYMDMVTYNRSIVDRGDSVSPNGWWLERNMDLWNDYFFAPQRTLKVDLQRMKKKAEEPKEINFKDI